MTWNKRLMQVAVLGVLPSLLSIEAYPITSSLAGQTFINPTQRAGRGAFCNPALSHKAVSEESGEGGMLQGSARPHSVDLPRE